MFTKNEWVLPPGAVTNNDTPKRRHPTNESSEFPMSKVTHTHLIQIHVMRFDSIIIVNVVSAMAGFEGCRRKFDKSCALFRWADHDFYLRLARMLVLLPNGQSE